MLKEKIADMQQKLNRSVTDENLSSEAILNMSRELDSEMTNYVRAGSSKGRTVEINREKVCRQLLVEYCGGNCNLLAREMRVDPAHLHRFLKTGIGGGKKILGGIFIFCESRGLDFRKYIEIKTGSRKRQRT